MNNPTTALIISTYNKPEELEITLKSVLAQSVMPDEVIIADDGSKVPTQLLVEQYQGIFKIPFIHVWHEDNGFRLAEIRNKALAKASTDYIIQIDGDIIIHKHFIKDHLAFAKKGTFVRASRSYINEKISDQILWNKKVNLSYLSRGITNRLSAIHLPVAWKLFEHNYKKSEPYEIHGCNMAFWRAEAISVNGYNENFVGWGPEDKEFVVRMLNKGYKKRFIKMGGICFHIWHTENTKPNLKQNEAEFYAAIEEKRTFCVNGIDKHL